MTDLIHKLQSEKNRLNATEIEIIYSDESVSEYELQYEDEQTEDLDIEQTLVKLQNLPDNAGSSAFWASVVG